MSICVLHFAAKFHASNDFNSIRILEAHICHLHLTYFLINLWNNPALNIVAQVANCVTTMCMDEEVLATAEALKLWPPEAKSLPDKLRGSQKEARQQLVDWMNGWLIEINQQMFDNFFF